MPLPPGTTLRHFEITGHLGESGMLHKQRKEIEVSLGSDCRRELHRKWARF